MKWILIVYMTASVPMTNTEFNTREACETARAWVTARNNSSWVGPRAECFPKGRNMRYGK